MGESFWRNEYRTTTICVDSYSESELSGQFYNLYLENGEQFQSLMQLLLRMEHLLNQMNFPRTYVSPRSFSSEPAPNFIPAKPSERKAGKVATFEVRVLFRQHASWQGTIAWIEGRQEENFRSVLELVQLMASALQKGGVADPEYRPSEPPGAQKPDSKAL